MRRHKCSQCGRRFFFHDNYWLHYQCCRSVAYCDWLLAGGFYAKPSDRGSAAPNVVALLGLTVVGTGVGISFAHPHIAWWLLPLCVAWLMAGVAIACVVGGGER